MEKDSIKIKFASYSLVDVLYDLLNCGISDITITKEDNDLEIVIGKEQLSLIKYPPREKNMECNKNEY